MGGSYPETEAKMLRKGKFKMKKETIKIDRNNDYVMKTEEDRNKNN